ncbi:MAG: type II secretion system F family protein [Nitrospirota bacterium]|nr:MAG: type II secretion system F family protein [Nitrospirota bacterium]
MPIYKYIGFNSNGVEEKGVIEADGLKDAVGRLKKSGILPKDIRSRSEGKRSRFFVRDRSDKVAQITRQLSVLISSGVSVNDSLRSMSDENSGFWQSLLIDLKDSIASGAGLSRSMEAYPDIFPEYYISMVNAGETGGMLDEVLLNLADYLEKDISIRSKVKNAMVYPLFMLSVGIIVMSFVLTFVVPKIVSIFESSKASLPLITKILIGISSFFNGYWWLIIMAIVIAYFVINKIMRDRPGVFDPLLMHIPVIKSLYIARFTRIFGFLLNGGIPLIRSLDMAARATGNRVLKEMLTSASGKISEGAGIASSLKGLPPVLRQMIATGERSGELSGLLDRAADSYEEDFSKKVKVALSVMEPAMIVIMGLVVGFIVFAVLLPIFEMNQLIR